MSDIFAKQEWRHRHRVLAIVLLAALGLRLGWCMSRPTTAAAIDALPDQREYLTLAQNLLHGQGLQFIDQRFDDRVYAFRTPGYPLFLAACGADVRVARGIQALLDTSVVLATYLLAAMLLRGSGAAGLAAALLVAVNPYLIYFSGLLLSETLFTAMLVWSMVLLLQGRTGEAALWKCNLTWLGGGVLLALSALVRPSAIGLPLVIGLTAIVANYGRTGAYANAEGQGRVYGRGLLTGAAILLVLTVLVLLPWSARNYRMLGHWVWLDTNSGFTLYDGYNPHANGGSNQTWIEGDGELHSLSEVGRTEYLTKKARNYVGSHPARCLSLAVAKLARTWSPVPLSSEYGQAKYRLIALMYSIPFGLLVLLGLCWGDCPRRTRIFLLTPAIYFSIVHALTVGSLRYRIPAEPPMAILAAAFIVRLKARVTV